MRNFIDILNEMPLSKINYNPDQEGTSFSKVDRALLASPKAQAKMIRAFRNTPFDIEVFFVPNYALNYADNDMVDDHAENMGAGVHDIIEPERIDGIELPVIEGKPGTIRLVMLSNLSPTEAKMPITGWTIAHKLAHAIQDDAQTNHGTEWREWIALINQLLSDMVAAQEKYPPYKMKKFGYEYPAWIAEYLTMKSARDGKLKMSFETFAEIVAQYLIAGRITIKVEAQEIVQHINDAVEELLTSVVGKVLVEV
jgi:hypothetical protein